MMRGILIAAIVMLMSGCDGPAPGPDASIDPSIDADLDAPPPNGTLIITVIEPDAGDRDR